MRLSLSLLIWCIVSLASMAPPLASAGNDTDWRNEIPQYDLGCVWISADDEVFTAGTDGTLLHYKSNCWHSATIGESVTFKGIWGSAGNDVFAVGEGGTIVHFDGDTWAIMDSGTNMDLWAVWGASAQSVFAVGSEGTILHYDGAAWRSMHLDTPNTFRDIWGTAEDNIFVVGGRIEGAPPRSFSTYGTVLHFDGNAWAEIDLAEYGDTIFHSVWGVSDQHFYVVGNNGVFTYDGQKWRKIEYEFDTQLEDIYGSSDTDIYVVGGMDDWHRREQAIYHFDGQVWRRMNGGGISGLLATSLDAHGDAYAVGYNGTILYQVGSSWHIEVGGISGHFNDVWGSSSSDVFAVGMAGLIAHFDGRSWRLMESGTPLNIYGVWGSSGENVFAVGGYPGVILHYDGYGWQEMRSDLPYTLKDVKGLSDQDIYAIADTSHGTNLLHYDGTEWREKYTDISTTPNGFRVDAPDNILISGQVEPLVHFDGTNWSPVPGSFDILYDIWGSSWNDIFVVGMNGATHHFDGSGWTKMDKPQNEWEPNLFGVWGSDGADVYAVGLFGTVRHYDGTSWQSVPNPGENTLKRVWGSPEGIVYAVGEDSTIISTNPEPAPDSHCNPSPEAGFSAATASGPAPLVVDFVDDTTGIARSWHWDFGDGSDSTDHNPTHTFDIPGTYTVTLTVAGRDGSDSETKFGFITVSDSRIENGDDGDGGGGCFINTAFPTHIIPLKWVVYPFNFLERHKVSLMYSRRSIRTETAKQAQP